MENFAHGEAPSEPRLNPKLEIFISIIPHKLMGEHRKSNNSFPQIGLTIEPGMSYIVNLRTIKTHSSAMKNQRSYVEHPGKAVEADTRFKHVMALTLDPLSRNKEGVVRCITSREGDTEFSGSIDRSVLCKVRGKSLEHFSIGEPIVIEKELEIVIHLGGSNWDFLGLEDPDIWTDLKTGLMHLYFTIPLRNNSDGRTLTHLGHAAGKNLDSLRMTFPVLTANPEKNGGAKEVSIAPLNKQGIRYNLVESSEQDNGVWYSTIRVGIAEDIDKVWEFGETVFHPAEHGIPWIEGHASPGPLLPETFIDVGESKRVGILNGREKNQKVGNKIKYGMFSVGLFIYDYENGKMDWVSPEPIIRDSQARTSTFASQFVQIDRSNGILYAQVDNSFVRAFTLNADTLKSLVNI